MLNELFKYEIFIETLKVLLERKVRRDLSDTPNQLLCLINKESIRTSCWIASILATSNEEKILAKVLLFTNLLLQEPDTGISGNLINQFAKTIYARTGNIPNIELHLSKTDDFSIYLGFEYYAEKYLNSCKGFEQNDIFIGTRFQKNLWEDIKKKKSCIVTAPTSAGKSYVIKEFIKYQCSNTNLFSVLYIVPTKALISEVSSEFRKHFKGNDKIRIYTNAPNSPLDDKSSIFVLTQERCNRLITEVSPLKIDFIFVDEIQKISDEQRGPLLEYMLSSLCEFLDTAQLVAAGPFLKNTESIERLLKRTSDKSVKFEHPQTRNSPISQISISIAPIANKNEINIKVYYSKELLHSFISKLSHFLGCRR